MADIPVKTRRITRDKLAAIANGNPELIRLLESLTSDVIVTLPDAINFNDLTPVYAQLTANAATMAAQQAQIIDLQRQLLTAYRSLGALDDLRRAIADLQAITLGA
jgi:hypothetical protein